MHVNELRALLQNWLNMEKASILGNFPLLYMEGNEAKVIKSALKNAGKYNLYYFRKRRVGLLSVFDYCLSEHLLCLSE